MTDKNIFAYKFFLSLKISDFNLFCIRKFQQGSKENGGRGLEKIEEGDISDVGIEWLGTLCQLFLSNILGVIV